MLEYFTYKKIKKHQAQKKAEEGKAAPVLSQEDEEFLKRIVSAEGTPPPLPERPISINLEPSDLTDDGDSTVSGAEEPEKHDGHKEKGKGKGKSKEHDKDAEKAKRKTNRFSIFRKTDKDKPEHLKPQGPVTKSEAEREQDDLTRVLDDLNLAAVNNRAFSISTESQELVKKFTQILKDLINGVPTAYDDLVKLLDDSHGQLSKTYETLPSYLKKLITTLPNKLTSTLAPELLAVASEAQAFTGAGAATAAGTASSGGFAGMAKGLMTLTTLKNLVTKPGAVAGMLRAIVNALKLRWPAFLGTNILLSLGLFVLLFVFWYCYKRGREVRLEKEKAEGEAGVIDGSERIVDVTDEITPGSSAHPQITVSSDTAPPAQFNGKPKGTNTSKVKARPGPASGTI